MFLHYKRRYQTCLQMLEGVRHEYEGLRHAVLSYAGVLDPMAEGWVPILVGKTENQNRLEYTQSVKEYVVGILVGVTTDSNDLMGLVENYSSAAVDGDRYHTELLNAVKVFPPVYLQRRSAFANKKYKSKPLWWYKIHGVELPEEALDLHEVRILEMEVLGFEEFSREMLMGDLVAMAEVFGENFRLPRIIPTWEKMLVQSGQASFEVLRLRMVVSKGFFVREFVRDLSNKAKVPLCVYSLKRTKVF